MCLALALACISFPVSAQSPSLGVLAQEAEARRASQRPSQSAAAEAEARKAAAARAPITARWKSEQEWIVSDVVSAIQNIAAAANGAREQGPTTARASPGPGQGATLEISDHIWAAAAYVPTARAAIVNRQAQCVPANDELIAALLDPTTQIIQRENVRVSAKLRADLRCPGAHEEAALLIGALALREAAGVFTDTRRLISRMTAHLAVADALRTEPVSTRVRVLADAVQLTLIGRQKDALERLRALGPIDDSLDLLAWDRALRIRDHRGLAPAASTAARHAPGAVRMVQSAHHQARRGSRPQPFRQPAGADPSRRLGPDAAGGRLRGRRRGRQSLRPTDTCQRARGHRPRLADVLQYTV